MKPSYSQPDTGYAWVILLASFVGHLLQYGVVWTVGVFYVVFLENLDHSGSGQVALISSLNTAVYYGTGNYICTFCTFSLLLGGGDISIMLAGA